MLRIFLVIITFEVFLGTVAIMGVARVNPSIFSIITIGGIAFCVFVVAWARKRNREDRNKREEESKKRRETAKEKAAEYSKKASAHFFKAKFGFFPDDLYERRNEKEVLIKLSFLAKKLDIYAKARSMKENFLNRFLYNEFLARYQDCIDMLNKHHPEFVAKLPHWTEMPDFVAEWERQNHSTNGSQSSKMACQK